MEDLIIQAVQFLVGLLHLKAEMLAAIFGALFFVSELLGGIDSIKSSSVFQLISNVIKKLAGKA